MIKPSAFNRSQFRDYLIALSEDELIEQVIIPLFSKNGYLLYRINSHGPGEHGKDIIFYRNVPLFYDHEYIVVQAKAEKVNTSNVAKFAQQLIRALRVPFPDKSAGERQANYVMFINSHTHTNDVNFEFPYLIDGKNNIKVLSQENLIELLLVNNYIPDALTGQLDEYHFQSNSYEDLIRDILLSQDDKAINKFLDFELKIETRPLSNEIKAFIINYIFEKWNQDRTWEGTVRPMNWLNLYFEYIQPEQSPKLDDIFGEYLNSYHSWEARNNTLQIVAKITPAQIKTFENAFIKKVINAVYNYHILGDNPLVLKKFNEFKISGLADTAYREILDTIEEVIELRQRIGSEKDETIKATLREDYQNKNAVLFYFLHPEMRHLP